MLHIACVNTHFPQYMSKYITSFIQIGTAVLKQLVDKIRDEMQGLEGEEADQIRQHFENSLSHIRYAKESDGALYEDVVN